MRELRAAQVEEDLKNAPTFRPSINHNFRVKQEGDVTQRTIAWDANRRKKQADRRKASDQHKESLVRNTPAINDNSAKIAQMHAMRGRRGRDVSDHLYAHAEQQRLSREEMQERAIVEEIPGYPAITRQAADLVRSGKVSDRLYTAALEQRLRHQRAVEEANAVVMLESRRVERGSASNMAGRMQLLDGGNGAAKPGHSLYNRAEEASRRKKERIAREKADVKQQSNPMLNRKSLVMASNMKQSAQERLTAQRKRDVQNQERQALVQELGLSEPISSLADPELTFAPKINAVSARIVQARKENAMLGSGGGARGASTAGHEAGERLFRDGMKREQTVAQLRRAKVVKDMEQCTFKPQINKSSRGKSRGGGRKKNGGKAITVEGDGTPRRPPVEDRLGNWLQARNHRVQSAQKKTQNDDLDGCTFAPDLKHSLRINRPTAQGNDLPEASIGAGEPRYFEPPAEAQTPPRGPVPAALQVSASGELPPTPRALDSPSINLSAMAGLEAALLRENHRISSLTNDASTTPLPPRRQAPPVPAQEECTLKLYEVCCLCSLSLPW